MFTLQGLIKAMWGIQGMSSRNMPKMNGAYQFLNVLNSSHSTSNSESIVNINQAFWDKNMKNFLQWPILPRKKGIYW